MDDVALRNIHSHWDWGSVLSFILVAFSLCYGVSA